MIYYTVTVIISMINNGNDVLYNNNNDYNIPYNSNNYYMRYNNNNNRNDIQS